MRPFGRPRYIREDNITTDINKMQCDEVNSGAVATIMGTEAYKCNAQYRKENRWLREQNFLIHTDFMSHVLTKNYPVLVEVCSWKVHFTFKATSIKDY
jgi:hypothetical protein